MKSGPNVENMLNRAVSINKSRGTLKCLWNWLIKVVNDLGAFVTRSIK